MSSATAHIGCIFFFSVTEVAHTDASFSVEMLMQNFLLVCIHLFAQFCRRASAICEYCLQTVKVSFCVNLRLLSYFLIFVFRSTMSSFVELAFLHYRCACSEAYLTEDPWIWQATWNCIAFGTAFAEKKMLNIAVVILTFVWKWLPNVADGGNLGTMQNDVHSVGMIWDRSYATLALLRYIAIYSLARWR